MTSAPVKQMPVVDNEFRAALGELTIGQAIRARAEATPHDVVVREKQFGVYVSHTWSEHARNVTDAALGLIESGLQPGDTVAIMGDSTYRWMLADAAAISAGGVSFGIYSTCSIDEMLHQIRTAAPRVFVAENQEYVDKFLSISDQCPSVEYIVVDDTRALFAYSDPRLVSFDSLLEMGAKATPERRADLEQRLAAGQPDDVALLVFTSGTTGDSKAAMITHRNFLVGGSIQLYKMFPQLTGDREIRMISHLPMAHAFERIVSLYSPIGSSMVVHFGEDPEMLAATLFEVQPHFFHAVPRVWQKMAAQMITQVDRSSRLKKAVYRAAMRVGRRYRQAGWDGNEPGVMLSVGYWMARLVVFRPILRKSGLSKTMIAISGGTHIPEAVQATWQVWGLNLLNALGMTEAAFIAFQNTPFARPGPVGAKVPDLEIMISADGELCYWGAGVFKGYLGLPAETESSFADGWFCSGDIGDFDDHGQLSLRDRKKDIMVTAGGKNIAPSVIENAVKGSPYIAEFVLIAQDRKFPSGLVEIDHGTVAEWARIRGLVFTSFTSLTRLPEVVELISGEIEAANQHFARVEQVKKFRIIPKELDPEEGDTTPTRKVRRQQFADMFADLIDDMYEEERAEEALFQRAL